MHFETQLPFGFIMGKVVNGIKSAITDYFENTSIHGFRYVSEGRGWLYRLFWIINLVLAFCILYYFANQILQEAEENPTIATIDEVPIDLVPSPAISIMVPNTYDGEGYQTRFLNSIRASDPNVKITDSELLAPLKDLMVNYNNMFLRGYLGSMPPSFTIEAIKELEDAGKITMFRQFCAKVQELADAGQNIYNFMYAMNDVADSYFLVGDMEAIMQEHFVLSNASRTCTIETSTDDALKYQIVSGWLKLHAPIAMRKIYKHVRSSE